jgi:hypothetical protein
MARERSTTTGAGAGPDTKELFIGAVVPDAGEERAPTPKTLRDERRGFFSFAIRLIIFCVPLVLLVGGIELLLWRVGENWPLDRVIRFQQTNPHSFFARGTLDQGTFRYKYLQILRRHPDVLVLGSSRIMQFRAEMFGRQAPTFYNAGGIIHSIEDLHAFLERLPATATPKIVILGVDFWWLNPNEKKESIDSFSVGVETEGTYSWQGHANALAGYVRHPDSLRELFAYSFGKKFDRNAIGLQAVLHRQGFRPDGSRRFEIKLPATPEEWRRRLPGKKTVNKDILGENFPFAFTNGASPALLEQLRSALLKFKARGVFIIGYNPPVASEWAEVVSTSPRHKEFWKQYHEKVPELFHSLQFPFVDVIKPQQFGLDDRYMRNWYHAHDTFDMNLLRRLCEDPQIRALFPDVSAVAQKALSSPRTNPLYLDLGEQ